MKRLNTIKQYRKKRQTRSDKLVYLKRARRKRTVRGVARH